MTDNDVLEISLCPKDHLCPKCGEYVICDNDDEFARLRHEIERLTRELDAKETEWRLQEQMKDRAVADRDTAREALRISEAQALTHEHLVGAELTFHKSGDE